MDTIIQLVLAICVIGYLELRGKLLLHEMHLTMKAAEEASAKKLTAIHENGKKTLRLVDGAMLSQKEILATTARAKANETRDPVDITMADAAEKAFLDHKKLQDEVDADKAGELTDALTKIADITNHPEDIAAVEENRST